jgi:nucleoside phosphorylase
MSCSFPFINIWLMVGIGGGAPTREADVRLGDVVVGEQVIQYETGKGLRKGEIRWIGTPTRLPQAFSLAIAKLRASHARTQSQVKDILLKMAQRSPQMAAWARPKVEDKLFASSIVHVDDTLDCDSCNTMGLQIRPHRISEGPIIHYGKIASSNELIKDASVRDRLSSELGAI